MNLIYADLLKSVYQRVWENKRQHPSAKGFEEKDFVRILEEIALASWHGDGRTTTVRNIENHCVRSGLKYLLNEFKKKAEEGVTSLLLAFYFRQSGLDNQGDKTFEFTHKSFGEYLTAKRIVREVRLIHRKLEARQKDPDDGCDETDALQRWVNLCLHPMDEYLFKFVLDEMCLQNPLKVADWQQTLCHLFNFMLHHGMPMERLNPRPNFHQASQQARNAEEALLVVLNACAGVTKNISQIEWYSPEAFGTWISRLQGQRVGAIVFSLNHLSFLNLKDCILYFRDFYQANLSGVVLERANLSGAVLERANLERADLLKANLSGANLAGANLAGANLERTDLYRANLSDANFSDANLEGADLERGDLEGINLSDANLYRANLLKVNLEGANLERANLEGANLEGANLKGANLEGANLDRVRNYESANFKGSNLTGTVLEGKLET